jgi:HlyD family secretion protein
MKKKNNKRIFWIIAIVLIAAAAVGYFAITNANAQKNSVASLQTVKAEKGDLTAIIGATGTVHANQSATLGWQTSGRIEKIDVNIGDRVNSGDVLSSLLESSLPQSVILARSDLVSAQRSLDDLLNSTAQQAQAQLDLANTKDAYDQAIWNSLSSDSARTRNQNQIDAAQSEVYLLEDKVKDAQETYDKYKSRDDDDPIKAAALQTLANLKDSLDKARKNLNYYTQIPNSTDIAISDGKVAVALANYNDAQREWERLKDGPDPADITAAQAKITAIQATIDLAEITAPFAGTVTDISGMVGDQVNSGTAAFRVDDLSKLLVDVDVPEVDINRVQVGQSVEMTFDAITGVQYQGRVSEVARVGYESGGIVNFKVTIELLNPDEKVLPGMTAAVNIIVSEVKDVLMVPNRAVRVLNDKKVVYILKNSVPTPVEIAIGSSSDAYSEIVSGDLKAGDLVILNPPTDFSSYMTGGPFRR